MKKITQLYHKYRDQLIELFGFSYFHDPVSLSLLGLAGFMLLSIFLLLLFRINGSISQVPVVYNVIFGVTSSGSWTSLYGYFLVALAFAILNSLLAWILFEKERLLSYLLGFVSLIIYLVFFIYLYNLTLLVR